MQLGGRSFCEDLKATLQQHGSDTSAWVISAQDLSGLWQTRKAANDAPTRSALHLYMDSLDSLQSTEYCGNRSIGFK